ncbi:hypothetical protein ACS0TY_020688 [Phlomoides rotata]
MLTLGSMFLRRTELTSAPSCILDRHLCLSPILGSLYSGVPPRVDFLGELGYCLLPGSFHDGLQMAEIFDEENRYSHEKFNLDGQHGSQGLLHG